MAVKVNEPQAADPQQNADLVASGGMSVIARLVRLPPAAVQELWYA